MDTLLLRVRSKVKILENGCHMWTGSKRWDMKKRYAYGQCYFAGKLWLAHRFFWRLSGRDFIPGLELDHICRNKLCVNVGHLRQVTHQENTRNRPVSDRTECRLGHPLTVNAKGHKRCKTCGYERMRLWRLTHRDRMNEISRKSYAKCGKKGMRFIRRTVGPNYGLIAAQANPQILTAPQQKGA